MGFNIFFYRINKFIWGMSLADRPIICKKLQFLMANIVLSLWIQDSRLRKKLLQSNFFGLKIQGWRPSDSRSFFGSWILNLESCLLGLQKLFWDLESWILPPWVHFFFEILNLELWILPPWIQEVSLGSWILNLESDVLRKGWDGNKLAKKCNFWSPKNALSFRVQKVKNTL